MAATGPYKLQGHFPHVGSLTRQLLESEGEDGHDEEEGIEGGEPGQQVAEGEVGLHRPQEPEAAAPVALALAAAHRLRLVKTKIVIYRVTLVVVHLGWVDIDLGSSPGWWAVTVATDCLSRMMEHLRSKSTQPRCTTTRVTL